MDPKDMMVLDANAEALGIPKSSLMENAGQCVAQKIYEISNSCKVIIYAGTGGNGGDGFVTARHLMHRGYDVEIYFLGQESNIRSFETLMNWKILKKIIKKNNLITINEIADLPEPDNSDATIIVDAILGTGTRGELREPVSSAIDIINNSLGTKIAVDIPSGLDPSTGMINDKSVKADFTVTFHRAKTGLKKADKKFVGTIKVCDIGIPEDAEKYTGPGDLLRLTKRNEISHKGQNGRVLIVGGSKDYSGAPALAALAALRSGADLAVITCPEIVASPIRSYSPDLIVKSLSNEYIMFDDSSEILRLSENADSIVIGCGIGKNEETGLVLNEMIEKIQIPIVIDADALKIIDQGVIKESKNNIVLTPHNAEFKDFFGLNIPAELPNKIGIVNQASKNFGCSILLKGAVDVISNGQELKLNSTGNPGMTVGGTGDILAGLVGGLIAKGHNSYEAAYLGAYINGIAGDLAADDYGYNFVASDILEYIPLVFMDY
jgi:ADP-dependent NAD(P)H-hydrate dehydratase / NAD(P)H-hydrate epimerase